MSSPGSYDQTDEALVDLLVKQVTEGLSPAEQRAWEALDDPSAMAALREFERAAAAVALAANANPAPLSPALTARLLAAADDFLASDTGHGTSDAHSAVHNVTDIRAHRSTVAVSDAGSTTRAVAGWIAAAACLLLAVYGWRREPQTTSEPVAQVKAKVVPVITAPVVAPPPREPTPAEERDELLARSESLKVTFGATKDPSAAGVSGDVVWDPATQRGYMHLVGLAPNDPQARQYQLWIFDGERDKRYPVDGGVFDIPAAGGEVIIPIRAAVPVRLAKAFAITVEKPGGAVVSGREHILMLGAAPG